MTDYSDLAAIAGADNGADDDRPVSMVDKLEAIALTSDQIKAMPPTEAVIDGWLMRNSLAMLYGPSGGGKTFLAIDWTFHIATGSWWQGREVKGGPAVYVIAEGADAAGPRIDAWQQRNGIYNLANHQPVTWLPRRVNIFDLAETAALAEFVARRGPALVVIDTLARCMVGVEENSAKDTGIVIDHLDWIRTASKACVLVVHHSGMDLSRGARGSSALRGAMDTELEFVAADSRLTLKCTKQKDGPEPRALHLERVPVGESCAIGAAEFGGSSQQLAAGDLAALDALRSVQVPGGISVSVWLKSADVPERTFYDRRARLVARGLVSNLGTDRQPRYVVADDAEEES